MSHDRSFSSDGGVPGRGLRALIIALAVVGGLLINPVAAQAGAGSVHCGVTVYGAIEDKYLQFGAQGGPLGCPAGVEADAAGGGRWEAFQGGVIFWHPAAHIRAHVVWGAIQQKWQQYGREQGLGYPLTDEVVTPDGIGRFNHFERGSVYWTVNTGAHAIYGTIRDTWAAMGWERSCLGYPVADEADILGGGRYQLFQRGSIFWTSDAGAHATC